MNKEIANKILSETEKGYDLISNKFAETRKFFWRGLEFIGDYVKKNDVVLDFGCGNGRLLEIIDEANFRYIGVDVSQGLLDIAKNRHLHPVKSLQSGAAEGGFNRSNQTFQKIDPLQTTLPFADEYFNTIYSIAVFHHFPSKEYRESLAKEMYKKTKKGGHVIVTVWNLWQKKYMKNIFKNWRDIVIGKGELDWNDCYISFTDNQGNRFQRFHHAFTKRELKKLFSSAGFKVEKCEIINKRNILLIGKNI